MPIFKAPLPALALVLAWLPYARADTGYVCSMTYHGRHGRTVQELKKFSIRNGFVVLDQAKTKYAHWSGDRWRITLNNSAGTIAVKQSASSYEVSADTIAIDKTNETIREVFVSSLGHSSMYFSGSCENF